MRPRRCLAAGLLATAAITGGCGGLAGRLASAPSPSSRALAGDPPAAVPLDGTWSRRADGARSWSPVTLPDDFNPIVTPGSGRSSAFWYAITFRGPATAPGWGWNVGFESVRRHATIWLNGVRLGGSDDPYAPFTVAATSLRPGRPNRLLVRVDNDRGGDMLPEDWWNWGGILGPVTLQPAGPVAVSELGVVGQVACRLHCGSFAITALVRNRAAASAQPRVHVAITAPDGSPVAAASVRMPWLSPGGVRSLRLTVPLRGRPDLWSPANPALYHVSVTAADGGVVAQRDTVVTGLRRVEVRDGVLYLNGRRLWLHGASIHEDIAGRGAALADGDIDTIVSELRSVDANITRAHYLLSPRLLSALDAAGILVWAQPPVDHAGAALESRAARRRALALVRSTVLGDRNHPSVVIDSVGNELTPTPDRSPGVRAYLRGAVALTRELDPGTPVALDTYCYPGFPAQRVYRGLDVLGISSYFGWYRGLPGHSVARFAQLAPFLRQSHRRYPRQALVVSEYGAEGLYDGSAELKGSLEFQSDYLRRTVDTVASLPFMNGTIVWTLREFAVAPGWTGGAQLLPGYAPDGIHHKGLIAYDGVEKPAFAVAQALFATPPPFLR